MWRCRVCVPEETHILKPLPRKWYSYIWGGGPKTIHDLENKEDRALLVQVGERWDDDELFIWRSAGISQCGLGAGQFKRPLSPELWPSVDRVVLAADIGFIADLHWLRPVWRFLRWPTRDEKLTGGMRTPTGLTGWQPMRQFPGETWNWQKKLRSRPEELQLHKSSKLT